MQLIQYLNTYREYIFSADHLKDPLQDYIDKLQKVVLVREKERSGLIRARLLGFEHCTAEVAVFLDSHCEVTEGLNL